MENGHHPTLDYVLDRMYTLASTGNGRDMKSWIYIALFCGLGQFLISADAHGRSFRSEQLPNGERFDCATCHVNNTGGARNAFGQDVEEMGLSGVGGENTQDTVWAAVCNIDSDGDGYTNGVELGDPACTWEIDDPNPNFNPSRPGDSNSTPCGNGTIEGEEMCDGSNLNDTTCVDLGLPDGGLGCNVDCTFNTVNCVEAPANNPNPNNEPGTNNATNSASNNVTNQPTNNASTPTNPENPGSSGAPDPDDEEGSGELEPFFCDGEMSVKDEPKSAGMFAFLFALFSLRLFSSRD